MAYCETTHLLIGDIPLASKYQGGQTMIDFAADEIDSMLGHKYVIPVAPPDIPANKPTILLLKKINILLASGRIILDQAAGGEDNKRHEYGKSLLEEGQKLLYMIVNGDITLVGAELLPDEEAVDSDTVSIIQEDQYSMVGSFYERFQSAFPNSYPAIQIGGDV